MKFDHNLAKMDESYENFDEVLMNLLKTYR